MTAYTRTRAGAGQEFFNRFGFWGRLDPNSGVFEQIELKAQALHEHLPDFVRLYGRLADYRSKKTLYAILSNWYRYDFKTTAEAREYLFDDYFDLDIVRCTSDEVVVDLGAYTGDTVKSYITNYGEDCYRRIYCYEITPASLKSSNRPPTACATSSCGKRRRRRARRAQSRHESERLVEPARLSRRRRGRGYRRSTRT